MQNSQKNPLVERLLDTQQAAARLGLSPKTLETWRVRGGGPRFLKLGRAVRYAHSDLVAFLEERQRDVTL